MVNTLESTESDSFEVQIFKWKKQHKSGFKGLKKTVLDTCQIMITFTGPKIFCASPKILCRTKNLLTYCASHKHFVSEQNMICIQ